MKMLRRYLSRFMALLGKNKDAITGKKDKIEVINLNLPLAPINLHFMDDLFSENSGK